MLPGLEAFVCEASESHVGYGVQQIQRPLKVVRRLLLRVFRAPAVRRPLAFVLLALLFLFRRRRRRVLFGISGAFAHVVYFRPRRRRLGGQSARQSLARLARDARRRRGDHGQTACRGAPDLAGFLRQTNPRELDRVCATELAAGCVGAEDDVEAADVRDCAEGAESGAADGRVLSFSSVLRQPRPRVAQQLRVQTIALRRAQRAERGARSGARPDAARLSADAESRRAQSVAAEFVQPSKRGVEHAAGVAERK
mmetsp:Transcript_11571/g.40072  ORF Transcript_11571/g.40072 Transcript_11571/m.40072 type:complete len:254 (-) Transcript_11571:28-789(-)